MMNSKSEIHRFNVKSFFLAVFFGVARGLLLLSAVALAGFFLLGFFSEWLGLSGAAFRWLWALVAFGSLGAFVASFWPLKEFSLKNRSLYLALNAGEKFKQDDLLNAYQLAENSGPSGESAELRKTFLADISKKLALASALMTVPRGKWRRPLVFFCSVALLTSGLWAFFPRVFPFSARTLFPFGQNKIDALIHVQPGNATVPIGSDVTISAILGVESIDRPVLYLHRPEGWTSVEPEDFVGKETRFQLENVIQNVSYRFKWKNEWTSSYELVAEEPLRAQSFKVQIKTPAYATQRVITDDSPEIRALTGSAIIMSVALSEPVQEGKILFSNGTEKKADQVSGLEGRFSFSVVQSGTYQLAFSQEGEAFQTLSPVYPIEALPDEKPRIRLLSPEEDLIIGDKETLPLTFDADDDFGVARVSLEWELGSKKGGRSAWVGNPPKQGILETFAWNLSRESFRPGDALRYRLVAVDANKVTGPGQAFSEWRILEIESFESSHKAIEQALEKWRDDTLELLADISARQAQLEKEGPISAEEAQKFNETMEKSRQAQSFLEKIVEKMEKDPLSDYGVWLEHQAMADNFEALNQNEMKTAQASYQTGNKEQAAEEVAKAAAEVERMLALSEDLSKTQKARDVLENAGSLEKVGENLEDLLSSAEKMGAQTPPDVAKEIERLVSEAMKLLSEMAQALEQFPEQLPEDFVNQEALKDIDMGRSQDLLSQISEALKNGDFQKAADLARQFLDMAQKMSESFSDAHQSFVEERSPASLEKEIEEQASLLQELAETQRSIIAKTGTLEKKRLTKLIETQAETLKDLAAVQKRVRESVLTEMEKDLNSPLSSQVLQGVLPPMDVVLREFQSGVVDQAPSQLTQIVDRLAFLLKQEEEQGRPENPILNEALRAEREIMEKLKGKNLPPDFYSPEETKRFLQLENEQKELAARTEGIRKKVQALSQKTANLGGPLNLSLGEARQAMELAAEELRKRRSETSLSFESEALRRLMDAQNQMGSAQEAMKQMGESMSGGGQGGSGGGSPRILYRGGSKASKGKQTGKVLLPKAEDYKTPKEFRREVMESLKEKFPETYEDMIHQYFKRLAE